MLSNKQFFSLSLLFVAPFAVAEDKALTLKDAPVYYESAIVVDLNRAVMESVKGMEIAKKVQNKANELQKKLDTKKEEYTKFAKEFTEQKSTLSLKALDEKTQKGVAMEGELKLLAENSEREFNLRSQRAYEELGKDVQVAAEDLRKKKNVKRIVDVTGRTLACAPDADETSALLRFEMVQPLTNIFITSLQYIAAVESKKLLIEQSIIIIDDDERI